MYATRVDDRSRDSSYIPTSTTPNLTSAATESVASTSSSSVGISSRAQEVQDIVDIGGANNNEGIVNSNITPDITAKVTLVTSDNPYLNSVLHEIQSSPNTDTVTCNALLNAEGITLIFQALDTRVTLGMKPVTVLDLSGCDIMRDGATVIAEALKENKALTSINLSNNQIGAEGAEAIAKALKVNMALTSICLSSNDIGDKGAKAIAKALKVNSRLTSIGLGCNR